MDSQKNKTLNNTLRDIYESRYNELPRLFKLFKQEKEQSSAINLATLLFNLSKLIPGKINNVQKKCFIEVVRLIPSPPFQFDAHRNLLCLKSRNPSASTLISFPYKTTPHDLFISIRYKLWTLHTIKI